MNQSESFSYYHSKIYTKDYAKDFSLINVQYVTAQHDEKGMSKLFLEQTMNS